MRDIQMANSLYQFLHKEHICLDDLDFESIMIRYIYGDVY